jgi:hypothetical protein
VTDEQEIPEPAPMSRKQARVEAAKRIGGQDVKFQVDRGPTVDEDLPDEVAHPDRKKAS